MNDAKMHLDKGNLSAAVEAALALVKSNPTVYAARSFLFELSLFSGDWDRADRQLDVIGHQDANAAIASLIYRQNLSAERDRIKFFTEGLRPETPETPADHLNDLFAANDLIREGKTAEARESLDKVEEDRPAFPVKINGEGFSDFRDYNDSTMCAFEAIVKDSYVWLPFESVKSIRFLERKSLRDIYWPQAEFELTNGTNGELFLPSLYVNTWKNADDQVRLGRTVDWRDAGDDIFIGEGTRIFWMDGKDKPILDLQTIEFEHGE
ncbi:MAG: type VI secretion system accessory protein TagJ [Pyrinomonadaceae bacterium]